MLSLHHFNVFGCNGVSVVERWSPREHIFMSLALASKPQVLENCPVLGSRTALFLEWLKFCRSAEKCFSRPFFFFGDRRKKNFEDLFLRKTLAFVSLVLGLGLKHSCPWPWPRIFFVSLALASNLVSSTPSLVLWCSNVFTVTYLLLLFFSHLSFCNCKGSTAENCSEEASRFRKRNVKPINKLIGSTKSLWISIPMNATRPLFSLKTLNWYDIG